MKKVIVKLVRTLSWIVIGLDVIGSIALGFMLNQHNLLGLVIRKWQSNPFNFSDSDIVTVNTSILFLVIPILLLSFVKSEKIRRPSI